MAPRTGWLSLAFLIGLLSVRPIGILAQTTDAVCLSSFDWVSPSILDGVFHSQSVHWLDGQQQEPEPLSCFGVSPRRV